MQSDLGLSFLHMAYMAFFLCWACMFLARLNNIDRAIVLPSALASASASTNVKVFVKVFKTLLFTHLITNLIHLLYDYTNWSKILRSTIPNTLDHVKVKVTDLEFSC